MKLNSALQKNGPNAFERAERIIAEMNYKKWLRFVAGLRRMLK